MNSRLIAVLTVAASVGVLSLRTYAASQFLSVRESELRAEFIQSEPLEFSGASRFAKPIAPHLLVAGQPDLKWLPQITELSLRIFEAHGLTTLWLGNLDGFAAAPFTGLLMDADGRSVTNFVYEENQSIREIRQNLRRSSRPISWSFRALRTARAVDVTEGSTSDKEFVIKDEVRYRTVKAVAIKLHRLLAIGSSRPIWRFRGTGFDYDDVTPSSSAAALGSDYLERDFLEDFASTPTIDRLEPSDLGVQVGPHYWSRGNVAPAEVESGRELAAVIHAKFGLTMVALGREGGYYLPGFDGLLVDEDGKIIANYSQKILMSGGVRRYRAKINDALRKVGEFSKLERWTEFAMEAIGAWRLERFPGVRSTLIEEMRLLAIGQNRPVWTIVRAYDSCGLRSTAVELASNYTRSESFDHQRIVTLLDHELAITDANGTIVDVRPDGSQHHAGGVNQSVSRAALTEEFGAVKSRDMVVPEEIARSIAPHLWMVGEALPKEISSAAAIARGLGDVYGYDVVLLGHQSGIDTPGFDGLVVDRDRRVIANVTIKESERGTNKSFRANLRSAKERARTFSRIEPWVDVLMNPEVGHTVQLKDVKSIKNFNARKQTLLDLVGWLGIDSDRPVWIFLRLKEGSVLTADRAFLADAHLDQIERRIPQKIVILFDDEIAFIDRHAALLRKRHDCPGFLENPAPRLLNGGNV